MGVLLQAEELEIVYGQVSACRGLNFHIDDGEIVTLIGANGAGKSTTLRAIAGVLAPGREWFASMGPTSRTCLLMSGRNSVSRWFRRAGGCSPF